MQRLAASPLETRGELSLDLTKLAAAASKWNAYLRRLEGLRHILCRSKKFAVMLLGFISFTLIADTRRLV